MSAIFHIRPARVGDIAFLEDCALDAYAQYVEAIGRKPAPMVFDFKSRLNDTSIDVILSNDKRVGYLVWNLRKDCLFLESIAIATSRQGKGHARSAIEYLEEKAAQAGRTSIRLYTNEKMSANLSLYSHLGFRMTDRRTEEGFNRVYFQKDVDIDKQIKSI